VRLECLRRREATEVPGLTDFETAWQLFTRHWRVLVAAEFILLALWVTLEVSVVAVTRLASAAGWVPAGIAVNVVLHVAFLLVFSGVLVGLHRIALDAADGGTPTLSTLTHFLKVGPTYLLALALYCLAVLAGTLALVLPGIYLAVRLAFFGQVLASGKASAFGALRDSAALCADRWWSLFVLFFLAFALNLLGAAILGLGFFVTFPVTLLATTLRFRRCVGGAAGLRGSGPASVRDTKPEPPGIDRGLPNAAGSGCVAGNVSRPRQWSPGPSEFLDSPILMPWRIRGVH
jgi:hypothetical protein